MNSSRVRALRPQAHSEQEPSGPDGPQSDSGRSPWQVFGSRVRQLRGQAGLTPEKLHIPELCPAEMLRAIEEGRCEAMRPTASYLDTKLGAEGRLLDAWARALITAHLESGAPADALARQAHLIREFQPGLIPEELQTAGYAQGLAQARRPGSFGPVERDRHRRRTRMVHSGGPELALILNETALRAMPGTPAVAREQITHLRRYLAEDRVSLQVVPGGVSNHPCPSGPFRLLGFSPHHQVVHLPAPCGPGHLLTTPAAGGDYAELSTALAAAALSRDDSAALLESLLRELPEEPRALPAPADPGVVGSPSRGGIAVTVAP